MRFALAGPGRVGTSLSLWLLAGGAELVAIAGRDPRAPLDPRLPPAPRCGLGELESGGAELLLVTVADPAIEAVARQLAARPQAAVALHASGPLGAEALAPLAGGAGGQGSAVGTLHPLRAFPAVQETPQPGTFYGVGGAPAAVALARRLAVAWGGRAVEVPAERRRVYHLAATLAAGGVTTVFATLAELLDRAGLPPELLEANLHLMDGALAAVRRAAAERAEVESFDRAITGPAARGDLATLAGQRAALAGLAPDLAPVVAALQDEALRRGRRLRGEADASSLAIFSPRETPPVVDPERE